MVGEIILEHDGDEVDDRHLIDMALQLPQKQNEANTTKVNTTTYSQHYLTDTTEKMDLNFLECLLPLPTLYT